MGRKDYWLKSLGLAIASVLIAIILVSISESMFFLSILIYLGAGVLNFYWSMLRFHDVGLSGVWLLLSFVPFVGNLAVFIILLLPADTFDTYKKKHTETVTKTVTQTVNPTVNTVDTETEVK